MTSLHREIAKKNNYKRIEAKQAEYDRKEIKTIMEFETKIKRHKQVKTAQLYPNPFAIDALAHCPLRLSNSSAMMEESPLVKRSQSSSDISELEDDDEVYIYPPVVEEPITVSSDDETHTNSFKPNYDERSNAFHRRSDRNHNKMRIDSTTANYKTGPERMKCLTCFNCRERGHKAATCPHPRKPLICFVCRKPGHRHESCPWSVCSTCGRRKRSFSRGCDWCRSSTIPEKCRRSGHTVENSFENTMDAFLKDIRHSGNENVEERLQKGIELDQVCGRSYDQLDERRESFSGRYQTNLSEKSQHNVDGPVERSEDKSQSKIYLSESNAELLLASACGRQVLLKASSNHCVKVLLNFDDATLIVEGSSTHQSKFQNDLMELLDGIYKPIDGIPQSRTNIIRFISEHFVELLKLRPLKLEPARLYGQMIRSEGKMTESGNDKANCARKQLNMLLMGLAGLRDGRFHLAELSANLKYLQENDVTGEKLRQVRTVIKHHFSYVFTPVVHDDYPGMITKYVQMKQSNSFPPLNIDRSLLDVENEQALMDESLRNKSLSPTTDQNSLKRSYDSARDFHETTQHRKLKVAEKRGLTIAGNDESPTTETDEPVNCGDNSLAMGKVREAGANADAVVSHSIEPPSIDELDSENVAFSNKNDLAAALTNEVVNENDNGCKTI